MFSIKGYYEATPKLFRKVGDSILITCVGISPLVATLPITDGQQKWIMFGLSALGVVGKVITNFFTDEKEG